MDGILDKLLMEKSHNNVSKKKNRNNLPNWVRYLARAIQVVTEDEIQVTPSYVACVKLASAWKFDPQMSQEEAATRIFVDNEMELRASAERRDHHMSILNANALGLLQETHQVF